MASERQGRPHGMTRRGFLGAGMGGLVWLLCERVLGGPPPASPDTADKKPRPDRDLLDSEIARGFITAAAETIAEWTALASVQKRRAGLRRAIQQTLRRARIPQPDVANRSFSPPLQAQFRSQQWLMVLDEETLARGELSREEAAELLANIFHECRHAQQFYRIARLCAGYRGVAGVQDLQRHFQVPARIARQALTCPLRVGETAAREAAFWAQHTGTLTSNFDKTQAAYERLLRDSPRPPQAALDAIFERYFQHPLEKDAHRGYHLVKRLLAEGPSR